MTGRRALLFALAAAGFVASMISAPRGVRLLIRRVELVSLQAGRVNATQTPLSTDGLVRPGA